MFKKEILDKGGTNQSWDTEVSVWEMFYKEVTLELNLKEWLVFDPGALGKGGICISFYIFTYFIVKMYFQKNK